uniref:solute carrier family 22 member 11 isoform X2 n=1 Tax=Jaculus jaculus TaxID=51337 RepID=UPI001E1B6124|nr:solute carrier family 22 member 11 isoform X2 [Jaculus jaculus]
MAFEDLLAQAGGAGLSHVLQVITMLLPAILIPLHMLLENFSAAIPDHRCWAHILDNSSEVPANLIHEALLTVSIPTGPNQQLHQCRRFHQPQWQLLDANTTATNWSDASTEPCMDGWVYDNRTFTSTVVTTWDLVCDSQGLKPMGQSIFMAGILAGAFIWGVLSHRFGRKSMLCWCCLQVGMAGTSAIFAPHFLIYCGLRFLSAFGIAGIILAQTVLLMEWTTTCKRTVTMTILGCTYSLGQMVLAGLAFVLRDWRDLQLAASVPFLAIFLLSWWLPESARWLIATGQPARALQELHKVARINGCKEAKKTLTLEVLMSSMGEEAGSSREQAAVLDLFCVPLLCPRTCTMMTLLPDAVLLRPGPGPAEPGRGHLPPADPLRSRRLPRPGHHHPLTQVPGPPSDPGGLSSPSWALHPSQCTGSTRPSDPARGAGRDGEGLLWGQPDLLQHVPDGALPHSTEDDS